MPDLYTPLPMRRPVLLGLVFACLGVALAAGCGGEETVTPAPETVVGKLTVPETLELPPGDPAAGKEVYASAGCGACHVLADAGTTGTIGPNLDETLIAGAEKAGAELEPFTLESIIEPDALVAEGFQAGIMPQNYGDQLSDQELADLTAYLVQATGGAAPSPPPPAEPPPSAAGDPAAGKEVFDAQGCGACHTFAAAGSTGAIGPNLDTALAKDAEEEGQSLEAFAKESIVDPNAFVSEGFQPGIMPQAYRDQLSEQELADLVAFLTQTS